MKEGETYYLKDLLYALMLESYNDAAVAIAEHIGNTTEGFAEMMNEKARSLGCQNTYFITPNGLDAQIEGSDGTVLVHSTTAEDLARMMAYCVLESPEKERFLEITRTRNYCFSDTGNKKTVSCVNHNALLDMDKELLSGKTGFTGGAGYSYVAAEETEGRIFAIALLGSDGRRTKPGNGKMPKNCLRMEKIIFSTVTSIRNRNFRNFRQKTGFHKVEICQSQQWCSCFQKGKRSSLSCSEKGRR